MTLSFFSFFFFFERTFNRWPHQYTETFKTSKSNKIRSMTTDCSPSQVVGTDARHGHMSSRSDGHAEAAGRDVPVLRQFSPTEANKKKKEKKEK